MSYDPIADFVFRRPFFSAQDMRERLQRRTPLEVFLDQDVQEIFRLSLPITHSNFMGLIQQGKADAAFGDVILKYLLRVSERCTPFGLMAGLGIKQAGEVYPSDTLSQRKSWEAGEPAAPPLRYMRNPTLQFHDSGVSLYQVGGEQHYEWSQLDLGEDLLTYLRTSNLQGTREEHVQAITGFWDCPREQAEEVFGEFAAAGILVPERPVAFAPVASPTFAALGNPRMWGLWFETDPFSLSEEKHRFLVKLAGEFAQITPQLSRDRVRCPTWESAKWHMAEHHDHGPVPLLSLTERCLRQYRDKVERKERALNSTEAELWDLVEGLPTCKSVLALDQATWSRWLDRADHELAPVLAAHFAVDGTQSCWMYTGLAARSATSQLGRFGFFHEDCSALIKRLHAFENELSTATPVDLEHRPANPKLRLLQQRHAYLPRYIDCVGSASSSSEAVPVGDLGFIKDGRDDWQLIRLSSGEALIPHMTHATNYRLDNFMPYTVLREYLLSRQTLVANFPWPRKLQLRDFLPRVEFKGVVLSPARWRLDSYARLAGVRHQLPEFVTVSHGDTKLHLSKSHPLFEKEVGRYLRKEEEIWIEEDLHAGADARYEICLWGKQRHPSPKLAPRQYQRGPSAFESFRVFLDPARKAKLLLELARVWPNWDGAFFVFYHEPRYSMRLRYPSSLRHEVLDVLFALRSQEVILDFQSARYEPEMDRWGGERGLELFERMSAFDVGRMLSRPAGHDLVAEGSHTVAYWLKIFNLNDNEKAEICRMGFSTRVAGKASEAPSVMVELGNDILPKAELLLDAEMFLQQLTVQLRCLWVLSFIHMSLNRLGLDGMPVEEKRCFQEAYRKMELYLIASI